MVKLALSWVNIENNWLAKTPGKVQKRKNYGEAAHQIFEEMLRADTLVYGEQLLLAKRNLTQFYRYDAADARTSDSLLVSAMWLIELLAKKQPQKYAEMLATMLTEYMDLSSKIGTNDFRFLMRDQYDALYQKIQRDHPTGDFFEWQALLYIQSAEMAKKVDENELRSLALKKAERIFAGLHRDFPEKYGFELAGCRARLGKIMDAQKKHTDAQRYFESAAAGLERLLAAGAPINPRGALENSLAEVLFDLAGLLGRHGEVARADTCWQRGLYLQKSLFGIAPQAADFLRTGRAQRLVEYAGFRLENFAWDEKTAQPLLQTRDLYLEKGSRSEMPLPMRYRDALHLLCKIYLFRGEVDKALPLLKDLLELEIPVSPPPPGQSPDEQFAQKQLEEAQFRQHLQNAVARLGDFQWDEASGFLRKAATPPSPESLELVAITHFYFGQFCFDHRRATAAREHFTVAFLAYQEQGEALGKAGVFQNGTASAAAAVPVMAVQAVLRWVESDFEIFKETKNRDLLDEAKKCLNAAETALKNMPEVPARADLLLKLRTLKKK